MLSIKKFLMTSISMLKEKYNLIEMSRLVVRGLVYVLRFLVDSFSVQCLGLFTRSCRRPRDPYLMLKIFHWYPYSHLEDKDTFGRSFLVV